MLLVGRCVEDVSVSAAAAFAFESTLGLGLDLRDTVDAEDLEEKLVKLERRELKLALALAVALPLASLVVGPAVIVSRAVCALSSSPTSASGRPDEDAGYDQVFAGEMGRRAGTR